MERLSGNNNDSGFLLPNTLGLIFNSKTFTFEIAFKADSETGRDILIGNYSASTNFNFERNSSGYTDTSTRFLWNGGVQDVKLSNTKTRNMKTTLSIIVNGKTIKSYVDGELKDEKEISLDVINPQNIYLGKDMRTGATVFGERIYSVRLYNYTLDNSKIFDNYNVDKKRFNF